MIECAAKTEAECEALDGKGSEADKQLRSLERDPVGKFEFTVLAFFGRIRSRDEECASSG